MLQLGVLADDLTGGMMVASLLEREGIECPLVTTVAALADIPSSATAVVVARKMRLIPSEEAQAEAEKAVHALQAIGCARLYYKYCATFDSTSEGNIGPAVEAMMSVLGVTQSLFCPAFPEYTVTIFQGRMFLGNTLLGDSFKQYDPVTPMNNSNLVEVLQAQSTKKVGLISHALIRAGGEAVRQHLEADNAPELYIADAADDDDLARIADFALEWPLTSGADALPVFLARAWLKGGQSGSNHFPKSVLPASPGKEAFIAGSCASATLTQVTYFEDRYPVFRIDLIAASKDSQYIEKIVDWAKDQVESVPIAVSTSATVEQLTFIQNELGRTGAAKLADQILGDVSVRLYQMGVRNFVVAGGETSGQVINCLGIKRVEVSSFDELGGGYCHQPGSDPISLVLKAGALGKQDFVFSALERMRAAQGKAN